MRNRVVKQMTIEEIRAYQPVGNFHSDQKAWDACAAFVCNAANPMEQRIEAIMKIDEITGEVQEHYNEEDVHVFVFDAN